MKNIQLSPRLQSVADLVMPGAHVADVGCDHGYVSIYLRQIGTASSVVASDIRPDPLQTAQRNARNAGVDGIRFVLCDGLTAVQPGEADTVILAGLGGETMCEILSPAPWILSGVRLILQPMTKPEVLRKFLFDSGICLTQERLVEDNGKIYAVLSAEGGKPDAYRPGEYYTGRYAQIESQPLFSVWLDRFIKRAEHAVRGLEAAGRENSDQLLREKALLAEWKQAQQFRLPSKDS